MTKATIDCSREWFENLPKKVKKGKLYYYKDNVPQQNPIMFKV